MTSTMQSEKECWLCRWLYNNSNTYGLEEHHVFPGTANRKKSEQYGLKVWLCYEHHRTGKNAVHNCRATMDLLKAEGQETFEKSHTREEFIKEFGKNYLED